MGKEVDSLLFQFLLKGVDPYPRTAIDMLIHLTAARPPRWLRMAKQLLDDYSHDAKASQL